MQSVSHGLKLSALSGGYQFAGGCSLSDTAPRPHAVRAACNLPGPAARWAGAAITGIPTPAVLTAHNTPAAKEPEASMQITISEKAAALVQERGESVMVHLIPPLG